MQDGKMNDELRMWEIDTSSNAAKPLESANRMETEQSLEELLVRNPEMLMPGLTLVGRQTPTDTGNLDLLGVDGEGRLVVFELKRERLTRDAVAQVIDYCSWLESLTETYLAEHIASHSGTSGVVKIDDFESWYDVRRSKQLIELRPTRMVLVGLGVDTCAQRMVEFLARRGVDISLLTFHRYKHGDRVLLARRAEGSAEVGRAGSGRTQSEEERCSMLAEHAAELGIDNLWLDAVKALSITFVPKANKNGITFSLPGITVPDNANVRSTHSVVLDPPDRVRVTFFPGAVDVCWDEFQKTKGTIPFECEEPLHAPPTKKVPKQWYCRLNQEEWKRNREALTALAKDLLDAWPERMLGGSA